MQPTIQETIHAEKLQAFNSAKQAHAIKRGAKIFYAVQATGNGHISRAIQLLPYLQKWGTVDVFLSGANATLPSFLPVKFQSRGLSLYYSRCGGLDYKRMWRYNSIYRARKEALHLPDQDNSFWFHLIFLWRVTGVKIL